MYNFGQPRVGDKDFSAFVTAKNLTPNSYRIVHHQDIVPHTPSENPLMGFRHACIEVYEDENHVLHGCSITDCEDTTCSDQWSTFHLGVDDHLTYLNKCIGQACGYCKQKQMFLQ